MTQDQTNAMDTLIKYMSEPEVLIPTKIDKPFTQWIDSAIQRAKDQNVEDITLRLSPDRYEQLTMQLNVEQLKEYKGIPIVVNERYLRGSKITGRRPYA